VQIVRRHPSGIEVHAAARELRSKTLDSVSCRCSHRFFDLDGYKEAQDSFQLPASSFPLPASSFQLPASSIRS